MCPPRSRQRVIAFLVRNEHASFNPEWVAQVSILRPEFPSQWVLAGVPTQSRFPLCRVLWEMGRVRFDYPTLRKEREGWGTRRLVAGIDPKKRVRCEINCARYPYGEAARPVFSSSGVTRVWRPDTGPSADRGSAKASGYGAARRSVKNPGYARPAATRASRSGASARHGALRARADSDFGNGLRACTLSGSRGPRSHADGRCRTLSHGQTGRSRSAARAGSPFHRPHEHRQQLRPRPVLSGH